MQAPFKKKLNTGISILFFCKFLRNNGLSQNVVLKLSWLKTNAGTNIGPQNSMYWPLLLLIEFVKEVQRCILTLRNLSEGEGGGGGGGNQIPQEQGKMCQ